MVFDKDNRADGDFAVSKVSCMIVEEADIHDPGPGLPIIRVESDDISMLDDFVPDVVPILPTSNVILEFTVSSFWMNCVDEICCRMHYDIDWDENGQIDSVAKYDTGIGPQDSVCADPICNATCDWLYFNYSPELGSFKRSLLSNNSPNNFSIVPNPNDGNFSFRFNNKYDDIYMVRITNNLGVVLFEKHYKLSKGLIEKEFSLDLNSGIYIFSITNDSNEIINEKFIITE